MSEEIELKLAMAPTSLTKLRRHALLRTLASGRRPQKKELESCYYDTPDLLLKSQGMALRVRKDGAQRIQTLKAKLAGEESSNLQQVQEYEVVLPDGERPQLALIQHDGLRSFLAMHGVAERLQPVFTTKIMRHVLPVRLIESEIEVAFDEGEILAGTRTMPLSEAELELKSGRSVHLIQLAVALGEHFSFRLEPRSKAARGYALAVGEEEPVVNASKLELSEEMTAGDAFTLIARDCLEQIHGNEAAVISGNPDPETIHQLRVGVRRLRAAVSLFRPLMQEYVQEQLREELSWLQTGLGPARDWDVFQLETLQPIARRMPEETALQPMIEAVERLRQEARKTAEETLTDHRYAMLMLRLELWLREGSWQASGAAGYGETPLGRPGDQPAADFAQEALGKRVKQLMKRGRKRDEAVAESLHALRIAGKKLRYATEFFRGILKKSESKEVIAAIKELQDCLGSLNDAAVSQTLLAELEAKEPKKLSPRALGLVLGWQAARVENDLKQLQNSWTRAKDIVADFPSR